MFVDGPFLDSIMHLCLAFSEHLFKLFLHFFRIDLLHLYSLGFFALVVESRLGFYLISIFQEFSSHEATVLFIENFGLGAGSVKAIYRILFRPALSNFSLGHVVRVFPANASL